MKPLFILLTVLSSFAAKLSVANDGIVTSPILESFQTSFTEAKEVRWILGKTFVRAEFEFNGQYLTAFYAKEGKLIAITKNITSTQLPIFLQTDLKKDYANYWVSDLFEVSNEDGVHYFITLENADGKLVLKSSFAGWNVYQKKAKI